MRAHPLYVFRLHYYHVTWSFSGSQDLPIPLASTGEPLRSSSELIGCSSRPTTALWSNSQLKIVHQPYSLPSPRTFSSAVSATSEIHPRGSSPTSARYRGCITVQKYQLSFVHENSAWKVMSDFMPFLMIILNLSVSRACLSRPVLPIAYRAQPRPPPFVGTLFHGMITQYVRTRKFCVESCC
jgi:hypothetical protein